MDPTLLLVIGLGLFVTALLLAFGLVAYGRSTMAEAVTLERERRAAAEAQVAELEKILDHVEEEVSRREQGAKEDFARDRALRDAVRARDTVRLLRQFAPADPGASQPAGEPGREA